MKTFILILMAAFASPLFTVSMPRIARADENIGEKAEKSVRDTTRNAKQKKRKKSAKNAVKNAGEDVSDKAKDVKNKAD